jgi:hypothetical protein
MAVSPNCGALSLNKFSELASARLDVRGIGPIVRRVITMSYVLVTNQPNRIATVHEADCPHLGNHPATTASSERRSYDDGFSALSDARGSMPSNYGLCGHCLREVKQTIAAARG